MIKMRRSVSGRASTTSATSALSNRSQQQDRLSIISGNSSTASTLTHDSLLSAKGGGSLQTRKFKAGVGPLGAAREARETVRTVITTPNSTKKPDPLGQPATAVLNDSKKDPIKAAELHLSLAESCCSPAQRIAWFDRLAEVYAQDKWFAESAVCFAHSTAIIAKELEHKGIMKIDWSIFEWISREVSEVERKALPEGEDFQIAGFNTENLIQKIEKTVRALSLAERYEAIGPLYRLLIPILEKRNNFNSLMSVYAELHQSYSRASEIKVSGKRHLGTYFRVRFYGKKSFESDHETDWIYREVGLTSLAEISIKLKAQISESIGHERIQVEPGYEAGMNFDPNVAYVQVTHVKPLITNGRADKDFWTHTNIDEFVYESPVTEIGNKLTSGRAKGSIGKGGMGLGTEPAVTRQALKRTLLKVDGCFPACRRRLRVCSRKEQIFSPLDFACQKLLTKAAEIRAILATGVDGRQIDVKGLQLLLQGAVMPTVNAGPLAFAEAFTKDDQRQRYGEAKINELREAFRTLMSSCEAGLRANKSLITHDQAMYHEVLVNSFDGMHERLQTFFGESLRSASPPPEERKSSTLPKSASNILDSIGGLSIGGDI